MSLTQVFGYPIPTEWLYTIVPVMAFLGIGVPIISIWWLRRGGSLPSVRDNIPRLGGGGEGEINPVKQIVVGVVPVDPNGTLQLGKMLNATVEPRGLVIRDPNILDEETGEPDEQVVPLKTQNETLVPLHMIDETGMEVEFHLVLDKGELEGYSFSQIAKEGGLRRWDPLMVDYSLMSFLYVGWDMLRRGGLQNLVSTTTGKFLVGLAVGLPCILIGYIIGVHSH